ncbi:hypothetical protein [uncultured Nocardioides sp.]|uniref:hypothetical protein n=1 Tax=uncultured Nocardioides sp. TaxID=198441 RepID=UPI0026376AAD|nr:hypothetical protein [uncultured Nocardioides sp.]
MKKLLATATLTLATAGLVGLSAPAAQADDFAKKSGSCSRDASYTMKLRDTGGDDRDRTRVSFFINSDKSNRSWRVQVKRGGQRVATTTKRTNNRGNLTVTRVVRAEDDARFTVFAKSGYGETCRQVLSLDREDRD